jgi:hypothetical protein
MLHFIVYTLSAPWKACSRAPTPRKTPGVAKSNCASLEGGEGHFNTNKLGGNRYETKSVELDVAAVLNYMRNSVFTDFTSAHIAD